MEGDGRSERSSLASSGSSYDSRLAKYKNDCLAQIDFDKKKSTLQRQLLRNKDPTPEDNKSFQRLLKTLNMDNLEEPCLLPNCNHHPENTIGICINLQNKEKQAKEIDVKIVHLLNSLSQMEENNQVNTTPYLDGVNEIKGLQEEREIILTDITILSPCPIPNCLKHPVNPELQMEVENPQDSIQSTKRKNASDSSTPVNEEPGNKRQIGSDGFKVISPRKAAKPSKPKENGETISTSNKYDALQQEEIGKNKIPAINLKITKNYNLTLQQIHKEFPGSENRYINNSIAIQPTTTEQREEIIKFLDKKGEEYILSESEETRPIKVIIKGLPGDSDPTEIKLALEERNYIVNRISQLKNYREKTLYPIFLLEIKKTPKAENIFNENNLMHLKIRIESYRKKNTATICYNCSGFYHSARNCRMAPKCIKCGGKHPTRECEIKEKIKDPVCINCKENGHLAAWKGCPKFPKLTIRTGRPTYAQITRKSASETQVYPPENHHIEAPIQHHPRQETRNHPTLEAHTAEEINDLKDILIALKEIKNMLKEFPGLIEAAKLARKTKDPETKKLIILNALVN